ncbi:energy-coupling factor transporter transmembrane component T [Desulfotomaculum sp. 1211_IL3151]|uniref:energy-coupling factor transporter transmembrane component T n=1 Tax=Desulfotomaculum sp. 1211_IL3151 TaxID=3084055 RepID=UPI002FD9718E
MTDWLMYKEKGLFLQSFHPAASLFYLGTLFVLALCFNNPLYQVGLLLVLLLAIWSVDGLMVWEKYLKLSLFIAIPIVLINSLMGQNGKTIIWLGPQVPVVGQLTISMEAIYYSASMCIRLIEIISVFCLFNRMVHPDKAVSFFARFTGKTALVINMSMRLFPIMVREFERIKTVQRMRGVDFNKGTFLERMKNYSSVVSILLLSSLENSLEMAESMQARGFGSGPRSSYARNLLRPRDFICIFSCGLGLGIGLWGLAHDYGTYTFYPLIGYLISSNASMVVLLLVLLCLSMPVMLSWGGQHCLFIKSKI